MKDKEESIEKVDVKREVDKKIKEVLNNNDIPKPSNLSKKDDTSNQEKRNYVPNYYLEMKSLRRGRYADKKNDKKYKFTLENKKSLKMVEVSANTAIEACNFIGWRPRHVRVLSQELKKMTAEEGDV